LHSQVIANQNGRKCFEHGILESATSAPGTTWIRWLVLATGFRAFQQPASAVQARRFRIEACLSQARIYDLTREAFALRRDGLLPFPDLSAFRPYSSSKVWMLEKSLTSIRLSRLISASPNPRVATSS
jgi:hypothetical protein